MLQIDTTHSNKRGRKENKKPLHLNADCDVVVYVCIHMYYRARLELRIFLMALLDNSQSSCGSITGQT